MSKEKNNTIKKCLYCDNEYISESPTKNMCLDCYNKGYINTNSGSKVFSVLMVVLVSVFVLVLLFTLIKAPIINLICKTELKNNLSKELEMAKIKLYETSDNFDTLKIYDDSFDSLDFEEKVKYFIDIDKICNNVFNPYYEKVKNTNKDLPAYINVLIVCNNTVYDYEAPNLIINDKIVSLIDDLKQRISKKLETSSNDIETYLEKVTDEESLKYIVGIEDVSVCESELLYMVAKKEYEKDNYASAKEILEKLDTYKDAEIMLNDLNNLHKFDGNWSGYYYIVGVKGLTHKWIIDGNACYNIYDDDTHKNAYTKYYCVINNNTIYLYEKESDSSNTKNAKFTFKYKNEKLTYSGYYLGVKYNMELGKNSDSTELPTTVNIPTPKIGMTAEQVKNSTWGSPYKINKDTYSWGTKEQ